MILDLKNHRPTIKEERWKYTSLRALDHFPFLKVLQQSADLALIPALPFETAGRIVFVNGYWMPALSTLPTSVSMGDKLNIDAYAVIEQPIDCIFMTTDAAKDGEMNINLSIEVGESASAKIIFRTVGLTTEQYLSNINFNVLAEKDSSVSIYSIQTQSNEAYHFEQHFINAQASSKVNVHALSLGGKLSRTEVFVNYTGAHSTSNVYGIYHVNNSQHVDFHFDAEHLETHCATEQHARGCVDDHARAVFNGRVKVPKNAIKSSSEQSHHGLLLSQRARIDAKPELEIDCDDVQCRHGATVGALRQDAIFYLMSRGNDERTAKSMLELAHVISLLDKVQHEDIKAYMEDLIRRKHG